MFGKNKGDELLSYIREGRTMTRGEKLRLIAQLSVPSILSQMSAIVMFFIDHRWWAVWARASRHP